MKQAAKKENEVIIDAFVQRMLRYKKSITKTKQSVTIGNNKNDCRK